MSNGMYWNCQQLAQQKLGNPLLDGYVTQGVLAWEPVQTESPGTRNSPGNRSQGNKKQSVVSYNPSPPLHTLGFSPPSQCRTNHRHPPAPVQAGANLKFPRGQWGRTHTKVSWRATGHQCCLGSAEVTYL